MEGKDFIMEKKLFSLWFPSLVWAMYRMNPISLLHAQNIWKQLPYPTLSPTIIFKLRAFSVFKNFGDLLASAGSPTSSWFLAPCLYLQKPIWAHTMLPEASKADFLTAYSVMGLDQCYKCLIFTSRKQRILNSLCLESEHGLRHTVSLLSSQDRFCFPQGIISSVPPFLPPQKGSVFCAVL